MFGAIVVAKESRVRVRLQPRLVCMRDPPQYKLSFAQTVWLKFVAEADIIVVVVAVIIIINSDKNGRARK